MEEKELDTDIQNLEEAKASSTEERDADFSKLEDNNTGKIKELQELLTQEKDKYLLLLADFDNYKKRVIKERAELIKYQGEAVLAEFIEVLDNLERALKHADTNQENLKEGLNLILKQFNDILTKFDVTAVFGLGKQFDPKVYNAIGIVNATDEQQEGIIVEELKRAYTYKDKLLRVGEAIVASKVNENGKENS